MTACTVIQIGLLAMSGACIANAVRLYRAKHAVKRQHRRETKAHMKMFQPVRAKR